MAYENLINRIIKLYPLLFFLIFIIFVITHLFYSLYYPVFIGEKKTIYVPPGMKTWLLANNLEKEGIIRSSFYFKLIINLNNINIKAGYYEFSGFYNLFDVIKIFQKGGKGIKITITDGLTLKEIEDLFKKNGFKVDFSKYKIKDFPKLNLLNYFPPESNLEGFLAPDTYEFFPNENEKVILEKILQNFNKKYFTELLKGTEFNLYERLILASIIEKEAKFSEDFPIIAGILIKRLKNNMKLEVDAPLVYEKCNFTFCNEKLTKQDLKKDSPYNTYQKFGIPPTPISNPSLLAIKSVNNPLFTDYWFYLTNNEGKAIFSKTYQEHKKNIKMYLK
jgi:UPF0755 protein